MHEILPHTADVRVRLVAGDLVSLFREASEALLEIVRPLRAAGIGETITLTVKAHDSEKATAMKRSSLERISESLWEIPRSYRDDMRVPARASYSIERSSTSKTSVPRGSCFPSYAMPSGIQKRRRSPSTIS